MRAVVRISAAIAMMSATTQVYAQTARKWEVELHGGAAGGVSADDGSRQLPAAGSVFTVPSVFVNGLPLTSRAVPSWYFGDGVVLLDQLSGRVPIPRQTPLDPALRGPLVRSNAGGIIGVRVARVLTPRFSVELSFDRNLATFGLRDQVRSQVEASRAGFARTWNTFFSLFGSNPSISSVATLGARGGRQSTTTGTVIINFGRHSRLTPYAALGAGIVTTSGTPPGVRLQGDYAFVLQLPPVPFPFPVVSPAFHETDTVTVTPSFRRSPAAALGGGVKLALAQRWGVRLDVRDHVSRNTQETLLDANPTAAPGPAGTSGFLAFGPSPGIVFSTTPSVPSSLSAKNVSAFRTFKAKGIANRVNLTAGLYWRF